MTPHKAVTVNWTDICSQSKWTDEKGLPTPKLCQTRGFLTKDTPEYIVVSASVGMDAENDDEPFGDSTAIPRGVVQEMRFDEDEK